MPAKNVKPETAAAKRKRLAAEKIAADAVVAAAAAKTAAREARDHARVAAAAAAADEAKAARTAARDAAAERLVDGEVALQNALGVEDEVAVLAAVETLSDLLRDVKRAYGTRKVGGPIGPRTTGLGRYQLIAEDGTYLRGSDYRASASRDRSQAKARIRDGVEREGDKALATAALVDTEAVPA